MSDDNSSYWRDKSPGYRFTIHKVGAIYLGITAAGPQAAITDSDGVFVDVVELADISIESINPPGGMVHLRAYHRDWCLPYDVLERIYDMGASRKLDAIAQVRWYLRRDKRCRGTTGLYEVKALVEWVQCGDNWRPQDRRQPPISTLTSRNTQVAADSVWRPTSRHMVFPEPTFDTLRTRDL